MKAVPVSVIIPHRNRSAMIGKAIRSIQRQTLPAAEILIVDDASEPDHCAALDAYREHATILRLEKNVGAAQARNAGIKAAKGEFLAFLDDDDEWLPDKLQWQWNVLAQDPTLHAVAGPVIACHENGSEILLRSHSPEIMTRQTALEGTPALLQTLLVRKDVMENLSGLDPHFRIMEDQEFWIRFTAAGYRARYLSQPLARLDRSDMLRLTKDLDGYARAQCDIVTKHHALYEEVYGPGGARRHRGKIFRRMGVHKGGVQGRLTYLQGCMIGREWKSLARLVATGKMIDVPYATA